MKWVAAVLVVNNLDIDVYSLFIKADNKYEAKGKAIRVAERLFKRGQISVCVTAAGPDNLIDDPEQAIGGK